MKFFENLKKRLQSQKGMSGVIVALLLVVIGVGLVAGMNTYMDSAKTNTMNVVDGKLADVGVAAPSRTATSGN